MTPKRRAAIGADAAEVHRVAVSARRGAGAKGRRRGGVRRWRSAARVLPLFSLPTSRLRLS